MKVAISAILIFALVTGATMAQSLLGNCAGGFVGVDIVTGNVYCTPPSGSCSNSLDFSQSCNSQYAPVF